MSLWSRSLASCRDWLGLRHRDEGESANGAEAGDTADDTEWDVTDSENDSGTDDEGEPVLGGQVAPGIPILSLLCVKCSL